MVQKPCPDTLQARDYDYIASNRGPGQIRSPFTQGRKQYGLVHAGLPLHLGMDYEAIIPLRLQGPAGPERVINAIIDTGFNGFLTLPLALVTALGLPRLSRGRA
jgi:hypothetical protein